MNISEIYDQHKKPIIIAGVNVIAIVIIITGVVALKRASAGPIPPPEKAPTQDVVNFISSPRYTSQSSAFKLQYMQKTLNRYYSPQGVQNLSQELDKLPDHKIVQLRDNVMDSMALQITSESRVYNNTRNRQDRKRFIDRKIQQLDAFRSMVTGRGSSIGQASIIKSGRGGSAPNISAKPAMSKNLPADPPQLLKMALDRNKPADRAMAERYVFDLQQRAQQLKSYSAQKKQ